jgi:hypothetical protein
MTTLLPDKPQTRQTLAVTPMNARVFLAGTPKVGKTTLAASWAPKQSLIVDTQHGTDLLGGEHYVSHVKSWQEFVKVVESLLAGGHQFKTVMLDLVDDVWNFCDSAHAGRGRSLATATDDYGRAAKNAEGAFRDVVGRLLASDLGVWFLTHAKTVEENGATRYVPKLDGKVQTYVQGATQFVFLAEALGNKRVLHTQPSAKFEAGSRVPLPEPMAMDAAGLYKAMAAGLGAKGE